MGSRLGTNKGTVNVHLPPDVMAAFEQYRENNCPDSSTSALVRERPERSMLRAAQR